MKTFEDLCEDATAHAAGYFPKQNIGRSTIANWLTVAQRLPDATPQLHNAKILQLAKSLLSKLGADAEIDLLVEETRLQYEQMSSKQRTARDPNQHALSKKIAEAFVENQKAGVEPKIVLAVGVIGAVVAVVLLVVRLRAGRESIRRFSPSPDVLTLARIAKQSGEAAAVAQQLQRGILEPWRWTFHEAIAEIPKHGPFLEALKQAGAGGPAVTNSKKFDPKLMEDTEWVGPAPDSTCLVEEVLDPGFMLRGGGVVRRATVVCQTMDWQILAAHDHPVSKHVRAPGAGFVSDDLAYRRAWRARQGLLDAHRLREAFSERELQEWADALHDAFAKQLLAVPRRVGQLGERFRSLQMEQHGEEVFGDVMVLRVADRDGVPQYGLAVEDGLALLPAVVEVEEAL